MYRDKDSSKKKCPKTKKKRSKCEKGRSKLLESSVLSSGSPFDREAVNCQYAMAESFVKSILEWQCPIPREEFKDIADVILKRLGFLLEYDPLNGEDRKSQQMRFLADVIGSWVSGVVFEVAETRKTELEEECERRKQAMAEESEEESEDESQDDHPSKYDDYDDDDDDDDDDDEKPDDGGKPGGEKDKEEEKRPTSRGVRDFRVSDDKNGKRKSSDDDKFYDAQTDEAQDLDEKKTPIAEPGVAADKSTKDVTSDKDPSVVRLEEKGEEGPEAMKKEEEGGRAEEKLEKIESLDEGVLEKGEKGLASEELPVPFTEVPEKEEDEIPGKVQEPQVPQEADVPDAVKLVAAESGKVVSAEDSLASKDSTTKPAARAVDPETPAAVTEEKFQDQKTLDVEEEPKESEELAAKSVDPSSKQLEEKLQVPPALLSEKPDADIGKVTQKLPKLDQEPESPEKSAETRAISIEKVETPKTPVLDMESKEIVSQDDKILEPASPLLDPATGEAAPIPEVAVPKPEADASKPEVAKPMPEVAASKTEVAEKIPEVAVPKPAGVPESMREDPSLKPEVIETRPATTPLRSESKVEELKKPPKDSPLVAAARDPRDKLQVEEMDEERRKILETSRRSFESAEHLKEGLADWKETEKKTKEYPDGIVVDTKFRTDTPFVTFDKIFHTIYNAIETNEENSGVDPLTNRIHRAVYEKCSNIVQEEKPGQLSELTKDVLEVMSGKIAIWLRNILTESQMNFVDRFPATVQSNEVREWTSWISFISNSADDWSNWIQKTIRQAELLSNQPITRSDWNDWTETVDTDALKWRRFYLESLHQAHQKLTMIRDRQVVKTGTQTFPHHNYENEKEVKITDLENERRGSDRSS